MSVDADTLGRFMRYTPPATTGPEVTIDRSDVVGVQQAEFDSPAQRWRTLVHLRGGSTLLLADRYDDVREWYSGYDDEGGS